MPTRSITADGKTWLVFPSGRVTQYDRDEFGLLFVQRHRRRPRGARHALLAASARARANGRSSSSSDADLAAPLRHLAAERHVARSRLHGVTSSPVAGRRRRRLRRSPRAFDGVGRIARAGRRRSRGEARRARGDRAHRPRHARRHRRSACHRRGARRARRAGRRAERRRGRCRDAHPRSAPLATRAEMEAQLVALREMRRSRAARIVAAAERARRAHRVRRRSSSRRPAAPSGGRTWRARMIAEGWARRLSRRVRPLSRQRARRRSCRRTGSRFADAIGLIHDAGGLAMLAHPAQARHARADRGARRAGHRRRRGSAPEPFARGHRAHLGALVEHFSLVPSGGSDWHGAAEGPRRLGMMQVPADWLAASGRPGSRSRRVARRRPRARHRDGELDGAARSIALVTGAGHRVGRAIAVALGARGMRVAVHYNAPPTARAKRARESNRRAGRRSRLRGRPDERRGGRRARRRVAAKFGGARCAGELRRRHGAHAVRRGRRAKQWDDIMALNLRAPFFLSQAAAPLLRAARGVDREHRRPRGVRDVAGVCPAWHLEVRRRASDARAGARSRAEVRVAAIAPGTVLLPEKWDAEERGASCARRRRCSAREVRTTSSRDRAVHPRRRTTSPARRSSSTAAGMSAR